MVTYLESLSSPKIWNVVKNPKAGELVLVLEMTRFTPRSMAFSILLTAWTRARAFISAVNTNLLVRQPSSPFKVVSSVQ